MRVEDKVMLVLGAAYAAVWVAVHIKARVLKH